MTPTDGGAWVVVTWAVVLALSLAGVAVEWLVERRSRGSREDVVAVTWLLGDDSCRANGIEAEDHARWIVVSADGEHELDSTPRLERDAEAVAARLNRGD
tara:strand:+ start:366 stop:665 length:300 start_codon:yes stop_codon:yes gene_type:complete